MIKSRLRVAKSPVPRYPVLEVGGEVNYVCSVVIISQCNNRQFINKKGPKSKTANHSVRKLQMYSG